MRSRIFGRRSLSETSSNSMLARALSFTIDNASLASAALVQSLVTILSVSLFSDSRRLSPTQITLSNSSNTTPKPSPNRTPVFMFLNMAFTPRQDLLLFQNTPAHPLKLRPRKLLHRIRRVLNQRRHVQDQRHIAAAEDGRTADAVHVTEHLSERTDDGLELAHQRVHHQPGLATGVLHHHDVLAAVHAAGLVELLAQP